MEGQDQIGHLLQRLADQQKKMESSRWLFAQVGRKIGHFPRDLSRRIRRLLKKRNMRALLARGLSKMDPSAGKQGPVQNMPIRAHQLWMDELSTRMAESPEVMAAVAGMHQFLRSPEMTALVARAAALEPDIGTVTSAENGYLAPYNDPDYHHLRAMRSQLPKGPFAAVVLVPFGKLGGADLVAGTLARALAGGGRVLILRTEQSDWERPDWYPEGVETVDLSPLLTQMHSPLRALYTLIHDIGAPRLYNVNSQLGFQMFVDYGQRLARYFRLYAYYFCADHDRNGIESGYPIWYFANVLPVLEAAFCDTEYLADRLTQRFQLPQEMARRVRALPTPTLTTPAAEPVALRQVESRSGRARPRILWGGRFDRQKRFDLLVEVARLMPDLDFDVWGKAVLDAAPSLSRLPANLRIHPPFARYDELPLADCDGWLYTAAWDGLPTILIELGALGMPIVATGVGGVPELIGPETGWPVPAKQGAAGLVEALRAMLADPVARVARARALQARVASRHRFETYQKTVAEI